MTEHTVKIDDYGTKHWYLNGKLHREDGPAIEGINGYNVWYLNGKCHRENGPAIENSNGDNVWLLNGKRHRKDGPAVEYSNIFLSWFFKEWWLNDEQITKKQHKKATRKHKEYTVSELECMLGGKIKIVKEGN